MPKFTVKQTQLAYVSWFYEIEADDEEAALDAFYQGDHDGAFRHEIGDNSSLADSTEKVLEAEPEAPAKPLKMGRTREELLKELKIRHARDTKNLDSPTWRANNGRSYSFTIGHADALDEIINLVETNYVD